MVDESTIDTNLLYATVDDQVMSVPKFIERLEKVHIFQLSQCSKKHAFQEVVLRYTFENVLLKNVALQPQESQSSNPTF